MNSLEQSESANRRSPASGGSARLTKLEAKLIDQLSHVRVESTHGLAGQCSCSIAGANNALMRLHRLGLVGIEHKGVRGTHGHPTVWYSKSEKPWLRNILDDAKAAKAEWPKWAKSEAPNNYYPQ